MYPATVQLVLCSSFTRKASNQGVSVPVLKWCFLPHTKQNDLYHKKQFSTRTREAFSKVTFDHLDVLCKAICEYSQAVRESVCWTKDCLIWLKKYFNMVKGCIFIWILVPKKMSRPLHLPPSVILDPSANRTVTCKKVFRVVHFWPYYWNEKTFSCQGRKSLFSCPNSIVSSARGTFTWVKTSEWSETQPHKNGHKLSFTRE